MKRIAIMMVVVMMLLSSTAFTESASFQNGDSGAGVRSIQKTLVALDYLSEEYVTANYDDMTELAVLAFQLDHSLDPTGIADADTQHAISDALRSMLGGSTKDNTDQEQSLGADDNHSNNENNDTTKPSNSKDNNKPDIEIVRENVRIGKKEKYTGVIPAFYVAVLKNNTDTPLIINEISVDFEDAQGSLILTRDMISIYPGVIMPGENGYICERITNSFGDEGFDPHTIAKSILHYEVKGRPGFKFQDVTATDVKITDDGSWKRVTCRIQNNTNFALESQIIAAILFDSNGEFLTCCYSYESLKPNEKKGFELTDTNMDRSISIKGATAKIYVYDAFIY